MQFFQNIHSMQVAGNLKIIIAKDGADRLTVSVCYYDEGNGNKQGEQLAPLTLGGTPAELDADFFTLITQPIQQTAGLITNLVHYQKQQEQLRKQADQSKTAASSLATIKPTTEEERKYAEAMKLVADLDAKGKYREAWSKVPDSSLYPEQAAAIRQRKNELAQKFAPDMFADLPESTPQGIAEQQAEENVEEAETFENDEL